MVNFKKYEFRNFDFSLLVAVLILCIIGIFCIYKSDGLGMAKRQMIGVLIGIVVVFLSCLIDYHTICKFAILYYIFAVIILLLVRFSPLGSDHTTGAYRWLKVGFTEIQPSELVKIIIIVVMAVYFSKIQNKLNRWSIFFLSIVIVMIPISLILIQTDLSSSMVCMFIFVVMIFMAGLSFKIIGTTLLVMIPASVGGFWYILQPGQKLLTAVQQRRILSFLNPEEYALTGQYQQMRSVQAIASGKVLGKSLLGDASSSRLYDRVYVNESDFIFSVIGEELGFIGCLLVITLFSFIVFKCILISKRAKDFTGKMIALGVSAMFIFQSFVNMGVATSLLPNTGLPLPFLSYGLSSLLSNILGIALVINVGLGQGKHGLSFNTGDNEIFF